MFGHHSLHGEPTKDPKLNLHWSHCIAPTYFCYRRPGLQHVWAVSRRVSVLVVIPYPIDSV